MPLDFDKLKAESYDDLLVIALCEFSRFVDAHDRLASALERIAPTAAELQPAPETTEQPTCPCPPELRVKLDAVMGQPVAYKCGLCGEPAAQSVGGA